MKYKKIGKIEEPISSIAVGSWGFDPTCWGGYQEATAVHAVHAAMEHGVNLIDTAARYGNGKSEEIVGKALKGGYREKALLMTKFGIKAEYPNGKIVVSRDSSYDRVICECENSLTRLNEEYIDIYLQHWPDANTPVEATMAALGKLKQEGKIRYVGFCNTTKEAVEEALQYGDVDVIQMQYSMVNQEAKELLQWSGEHNIATVAYGSLGAGILTGTYRSMPEWPKDDARFTFYDVFREPKFSKCMGLVKALDTLVAKYNRPMAQIAVNWLIQHSFITSAICGIRTPEKAVQNCEATFWSLSEEDVKFLDEELCRLGL